MILTYKYRLKEKSKSKTLSRHAFAVNQVWNFCVETQRRTQKLYKEGSQLKWLSHFDFTALVKGTSKELGIHAQTIGSVCEQFVKSRDLHKKCPKFRTSSGPKKKLGWVPFQKQSRQIGGNAITYRKNTYRFFGAKRRPLPSVLIRLRGTTAFYVSRTRPISALSTGLRPMDAAQILRRRDVFHATG